MKIAILSNPKKLAAAYVVEGLLQEVQKHKGVQILLDKPLAEKLKRKDLLKTDQEMSSAADLLVVLGGDGTLIQTARDMAKKDIAMIGVNLGRLGYLAEIEKEHIEQTLERLITDEYETEERMMLCGITNIDGKEISIKDLVKMRIILLTQ